MIGLVGAVGTDLSKVIQILETRLTAFDYEVETIRISRDIIPSLSGSSYSGSDEHRRVNSSMDAGNQSRQQAGDNSILALGAASWIASRRKKEEGERPTPLPRRGFIINSLKHPEEVARLREIYALGFCLIGVYADDQRRRDFLEEDKRIKSKEKIQHLIERDAKEEFPHGQRLTDTFHLADFFVWIDGNDDQLKHSIWRILDLLFGHPNVTPTFDEYAMFLAFAASLRSADLSRQVGAVIAKNNEIIGTGANDCPRAGGGLYWPQVSRNKICDESGGRDYLREKDQNVVEQERIIEGVVDLAKKSGMNGAQVRDVMERSRIRDITEFGRVVHAEMEALLSCARNSDSTRSASLYSTTFPCHNCAKHIIAAGIERVVYVEPYPKSKAHEFHDDAIILGKEDGNSVTQKKVKFEPFVGVGPRMFLDLFSMRLGSGWELKRKEPNGSVRKWSRGSARLRLQMLPASYLDLELEASTIFKQAKGKEGD